MTNNQTVPEDVTAAQILEDAKAAGFDTMSPHGITWVGTYHELAKFAQLQRNRERNEGVAVPVYTVPIEVEGHDVLYRLQDHPEPRCDCGVLYTSPPSQAVEQALREAAALAVKLGCAGRTIMEVEREILDLITNNKEKSNG